MLSVVAISQLQKIVKYRDLVLPWRFICQRGSVVEQYFRKVWVVGPIPTAGSFFGGIKVASKASVFIPTAGSKLLILKPQLIPAWLLDLGD